MKLYLFLLLVLFSSQAISRQLVLIQGYLGQPSSWSNSGIAQQLDDHGWHYAGEFYFASDGARLQSPAIKTYQRSSPHKFYRVNLPTEASIINQAFYLSAYLKKLREVYPQQDIVLVGHSAGGVLARYVMVKNPGLSIKTLITIASPHLGTDSAELGKIVGNSPLAFIAPMIGANTINRSQGLYSDLLPEMPHRFLYWLNRQAHPDAEYISIVRDQQSPVGGDFIVSQDSQFLENVYNLRYRARSYVVQGSHGLTYTDGVIIVDLLNEREMPRVSNRVPVPHTAIVL